MIYSLFYIFVFFFNRPESTSKFQKLVSWLEKRQSDFLKLATFTMLLRYLTENLQYDFMSLVIDILL